MACEFAVILNRDAQKYADGGSLALERIHTLAECMTAYEPESELVRLNEGNEGNEGSEGARPTPVSTDLQSVLQQALDLFNQTDGWFDPTTGPLIELWRKCRVEQRIPNDQEIQITLQRVGGQHVSLVDDTVTLANGVKLNLGAVGKGFALDQAAQIMRAEKATNWLLHGGRSSILASGNHNNQAGWPVGIGNPIFTNQRLGVLVLKDQALGTSGSNIQYFRHAGKRYGHILNPKTGWPASQVASVTILAPTAAEADALSTAFFVGGVEFARSYCDNWPQVSAILIPFPETGKRLEPVLVNMPADRVSWSPEQVNLT
jgi:thiamine biosynthesis lipoprotein